MIHISVIIPVYNAEKYVEQSVLSAINQEQVSEILLIEDQSPDNSLEVCIKLSKKYKKVHLLRHPNGENRGAGASRNLGIQTSKYDYVTFLDADDYMLPNRFKKTVEIFEKHTDADGVYEAVGYHFEDIKLRDIHFKTNNMTSEEPLTTVKCEVAPKNLFLKQAPIGTYGYAHTNGWTVKKSIFSKTGYFNENLPLHQDTDLFMKFALAGRMYPGEIKKAVAIRRVHTENRITKKRTYNEKFYHRIRMWYSTWSWANANGYRCASLIIMQHLVRQIYNVEKSKNNYYYKMVLNNVNKAIKICPGLTHIKSMYLMILFVGLIKMYKSIIDK